MTKGKLRQLLTSVCETATFAQIVLKVCEHKHFSADKLRLPAPTLHPDSMLDVSLPQNAIVARRDFVDDDSARCSL